jgi:hypothetical protein
VKTLKLRSTHAECASRLVQVFLDSVAALTGDAGDATDPVATFDTVQVRQTFAKDDLVLKFCMSIRRSTFAVHATTA